MIDYGPTYHKPTIFLLFGLFPMLMATLLPLRPAAAQQTGIPDSLVNRQNRPASADTTASTGRVVRSDQEGAVNFQAQDSLVFNFEKFRIATLYGSSKVTHTSGELTAGKISLNLDKTRVSAQTQTPQDTLSQPVLLRQGDRLRSHSIEFNYKTEKGRFEVARTQVQDGQLIGTKVKNTSRDVVFLEDAIYSTCTLDHPHYYLKADRMKVVDQEEVFFTNARLFILDIPYPLVFPFGYVPAKLDRKQSGLLEPSYVFQDRRSRGIGLQNLGWFQYFNDYLVGQASVDIYTSGTFFLNSRAQYRNRDNYSGSVQIGFSRERGLESTDPGFGIRSEKNLSINHNQRFSPYANLSATVNLRTSGFFDRNSFDIDERAQTSTNSSFSYRYNHPENLYNFSISAQQNQNFRTNIAQLSGPNMNFSLKQFSPFSSGRPGAGSTSFYENISIRYQNNFRSDYRFNPIRGDSAEVNWFEALLDPGKYRQATGDFDHFKYGLRQQADISFGRIIPSQFLNVSANINYSEYWFPTTIRKSFDPVANQVTERQVRGFTTARDFNTGISFSTTFYGIWNQKIGNLNGFRHTLRPTFSFGYRPDFSKDFWGYYREVQVDTTGRTQIYSIFENEVFTGPGRGEVQSLNFNLENVLETRIVKRDSTGEIKDRTVKLIDQLNFSTSYNFAADSLKLSDLNATMSKNLANKINIRASARFNFYQRDTLGNKIDRFLWNGGGQLLEPLQWNVSANYTLRLGGGSGIRATDTPYYPAQYDPYNQSLFHTFNPSFNSGPVQPVNSPFSISLNFSYRWSLNPRGENRESATLNAQNITLKLTPKWDFSTRLGYDFVESELTPSQFTFRRNLHCWSLDFTMNPFGDFQYFFFGLRVNSGRIQSLFQKLPLLNNLERSSSPSGKGRPYGGF